jgi:ubiquinone/menaquinone biosynthesis C-methylase UbiE
MTIEPGKAAAKQVWGASPAGTTLAPGSEPGTKAFFDEARERRATREQPWLSGLVRFDRMRGAKVLEVGCGAGFDAFEFCRAGASYTGIDITPENVDRTRRHLGFYELVGDIREADAENLPFPDGSFDVVYSNGVLHHTPDIGRAFREARRVLGPDGEFLVLLYHRNSIFYRISLGLVEHRLRGGFRHGSLAERLSMVEFTTSAERPIVNVYSRADVTALLKKTGFEVVGTSVRKLLPEDMPGVPVLRLLWPRLPQRLMNAMARRWGWYVIARARVARPR